jgi:hypothetical protein
MLTLKRPMVRKLQCLSGLLITYQTKKPPDMNTLGYSILPLQSNSFRHTKATRYTHQPRLTNGLHMSPTMRWSASVTSRTSTSSSKSLSTHFTCIVPFQTHKISDSNSHLHNPRSKKWPRDTATAETSKSPSHRYRSSQSSATGKLPNPHPISICTHVLISPAPTAAAQAPASAL